MTKNQVRMFFKRYGQETGIRFVSSVMVSRIVLWLLNRFKKKWVKYLPGIRDRLRPCFIRIGRREYALLTFEIAGGSVPLITQCEIAVHEAEHGFQVRRFLKDGGNQTLWYRKYFDPLDPSFRALQEGGANAAEGEIRYAVFGKVPAPPDLGSYVMTPEGQELSDRVYKKHVDEVRKLGRGGATFESSRIALQIMREVGILKEF